MHTGTTREKDPPSCLIPPPDPQVPWRVSSVEVIGDLTMRVRFWDGLSGNVRFEPSSLRGVFEILKDPSIFSQAYIEYGAVTWPGGLDVAHDAMYDEIKAHGEWVLK